MTIPSTSAPRPPRAPAGPRSRGWVVGRVAGAPVIITPSWAIAAVVLTLIFAPQVSALAPRGGVPVYLVSFAFVLLLFASVFLHEVAHAVAARRLGHQVTELALTVWGGHTAYTGTTRRPRDAFWIAVVGPLTNLVLAVGFYLLYHAQVGSLTVWLLCYAAAFSNAFVGLFNLVPGLPLDGGQILESGVWAATGSRDRGTVAAGWGGRVVAVGIVALVLGIPFVRGDAPDLVLVLWAAVIGSFLWSGASAAISVGRARQQVAPMRAVDFLRPTAVVTVDASVAELARAGVEAGAWAVIVIDGTGRPVGTVDAATAASVPPELLASTPVAAVAQGIAPGAQIDLDLRGHELVSAVAAQARDAAVLPVLHEGHLVGVLVVADVMAAVRAAHRR